MAPTPLTQDECNAAVNAFLDQHMGMVHREDVGPLFGQLASICSEPVADASVSKHWRDAVTVALVGDRRSSGARQDVGGAAFPRGSSRMSSVPYWR